MAIRAYKNITPKVPASVYVDEAAVVIGDVELAEDCSIWPICSVRGDTNFIRIGARSNVHDGAIIRSQVLLGAGSLVTEGQELTSGYLWLGRPAKRGRALTEEERTWFKYVAHHYVELKNDYLQ